MVSLDVTRPRVRPHIFSMQRLKAVLHSLVLLRALVPVLTVFRASDLPRSRNGQVRVSFQRKSLMSNTGLPITNQTPLESIG